MTRTIPQPGPLGAQAAVVQLLLSLSWTVYVVFVPAMLAATGIARGWIAWVLLADQLVFALADYAAGAWTDRLVTAAAALRRALVVSVLVSTLAMVSLPWVAAAGSPTAWLVVAFAWVATSSALRAPLFTLLGRAQPANSPRLVALAVAGASVAAALAPLTGTLLRDADPRLPMLVSALGLCAAGVFVLLRLVPGGLAPPAASAAAPSPDAPVPSAAGTVAAAAPPAGADIAATRTRRGPLLLVLAAAFGVQVQVALLSARQLAHAGAALPARWLPVFWLAMAAGALLARRAARSGEAPGASRTTALELPLLFGAIALCVCAVAGAWQGAMPGGISAALVVLVAAQAVAGACWGVVLERAFARAVTRPAAGRPGTTAGLIFAALALAAVARLALAATQLAAPAALAWLPAVAWLTAWALATLERQAPAAAVKPAATDEPRA